MQTVFISKARVKALPIQAWTSPKGSSRLRLPLLFSVNDEVKMYRILFIFQTNKCTTYVYTCIYIYIYTHIY